MDAATEYPTPEVLLDAWREVSKLLAAGLEDVTDETLALPQGAPSTDGKMSGTVNFLAMHETYHLGQASYLRCWMGHKGPMG